MPDIRYTSGNVSGLTVNLVTNVKPNTTYTFTLDNLVHLKSDDGSPSGLSYSNEIDYNESIYTAGDPIQITTASDNVSVDLELVRNGNNIDVHVSNFSSDYAGYDYTFELRAYNDSALTTETQHKSFDTDFGFSVRQSFTGLSDITTNAYYFELNDFYNDTAGASVYANVDAKPNGLTQRVYDVRGLAYFRDSWTNYQLNDLNLNDVIELEPWKTDLSSEGASPGVVNNSENALSADGTVLCSTYVFDNAKIYCALYKYYNDKWVLKSKIISINTTIVDQSQAHRYPVDVYEFPNNQNYSCMALSGDASRLVVIGGTNTVVYDISSDLTSIFNGTPLSLPNPNPYSQIHDVSISMDGKTILISGFNLGSPDHAHVFDTNTDRVFDLSGNRIPGYVSNNQSYGSDCTLSGDGKTAVIFGSPTNIDGTGTGYIWKINEFSNDWEFVNQVGFGYAFRKVSCKLSHSGDTLFVCAPRPTGERVTDPSTMKVRGAIFERDDSTTPPTWVKVQEINETEMDSGSMAGDGKTIAYVSTTNKTSAGDVVFNLWKRDETTGTWTKHINSDTTHAKPQNSYVLSDSELSFDGSRFFAWRNWYDVDSTVYPFLDIISDKTQPVSNVFDYMNVKSTYFRFDYNFDYSTIASATWGSYSKFDVHEIGPTGNSYGYGYYDTTSISADGRFVLAGAPAENKAYLYDTTQSSAPVFTFPTNSTNNYGIRCAMDDLSTKFAISDSDRIYFYERKSYDTDDWEIRNVAHHKLNLNHFKMSKDGSTLVVSSKVDSSTFTKWHLGFDWTQEPPVASEFSGTRVGGLDLSYDGSYIVAAEHISSNEASMKIFYPGGNVEHTLTTRGHTHSFVISDSPDTTGFFTVIVGETKPHGTTMTTAEFKIIRFHQTTPETITETPKSISGLYDTRYGRYATMSYDGSLAVLSGTREDDPAEYHMGGAVLIQTSDGSLLKNFEYTNVLHSQTSGTNTDSLRNSYNGFGSGCRISSDNKNVLISGGGNAVLYSTT